MEDEPFDGYNEFPEYYKAFDKYHGCFDGSELIEKIWKEFKINKELMQNFLNSPTTPIGMSSLNISEDKNKSEVYLEYPTRDDSVYGEARSSIHVIDLGEKGKTVIFNVNFKNYPNDLIQLIHFKWESKGYKGKPHLETIVRLKEVCNTSLETVYDLSHMLLCELNEKYREFEDSLKI